MSISKRLGFFLILLAAQLLYFPLNKMLVGGSALKTTLDEFIPILPDWAFPYLVWIGGWLLLCFWAALKMPDQLWRPFLVANLLVICASMLVYWLYPTYVVRYLTAVPGEGAGANLLRWIYLNDGAYNAFPSGHIYSIALTAYFYARWQPKVTWFWAGLFLVVALSTLFTGQHYLWDVAGGVLFASGGIWLGLRFFSPTPSGNQKV